MAIAINGAITAAPLIAYMTTGLFAHMAYIRFFYLILGLAAALTCIAGVSGARREVHQ